MKEHIYVWWTKEDNDGEIECESFEDAVRTIGDVYEVWVDQFVGTPKDWNKMVSTNYAMAFCVDDTDEFLWIYEPKVSELYEAGWKPVEE